MSIDTPAIIAIIGAGPVGLEAALYARFLGYDVQVFERGAVAQNLRKLAAEETRLPAGRCCSPLGLRALCAQNPTWEPPALDSLWTPRELVENYLAPLAKSDLLSGHVAEQTRVLDIRRMEPEAVEESDEPDESMSDDDAFDDNAYDDEVAEYEDEPPRLPPLRVTVQGSDGAPSTFDADIVIDTSGSSADSNFLANVNIERTATSGRPVSHGDAATHGAAAELVLSEPNFYILGSKSRRRELGDFQIIDGLRQIRDLFGLIGGRASLDLYQDINRMREAVE